MDVDRFVARVSHLQIVVSRLRERELQSIINQCDECRWMLNICLSISKRTFAELALVKFDFVVVVVVVGIWQRMLPGKIIELARSATAQSVTT